MGHTTDVNPKASLDLHEEVPLSALAIPPEQRSPEIQGIYKDMSEKRIDSPDVPVAPVAPTFLSFDDFNKIEILVGTVLAAERVPKADKLLKLSVDLGEPEPRQIVAGIGLTFSPEGLVGQQFAFVANLAPKKIFKLESKGMILATGEPDKLSLVQVGGLSGGNPVPNGARLG
jgi:methionyl-tRNA synthetase